MVCSTQASRRFVPFSPRPILLGKENGFWNVFSCRRFVLNDHFPFLEPVGRMESPLPAPFSRPATSCHASGMAVEAILDMAYPVLAANQARRTMARYMSEHNDFLSCHANVVLSKSSITVLPRVALVMSLLEPRIRTSRRPVEEPLLHVACHLGRRLRHADRPSAKNIFSRSAHCAARWH